MLIHFAGGGHCAEYVARRLIREGHDLVLVEQDEGRCRELGESLDAQVITGSVASLATWRRAGLANADMFVACTASDETNVMACLIANELAPGAVKALRLRSPEFTDLQRMLADLGVRVDRVMHPESDIVARILRVLTVPGVADIRNFADGRVKVYSMNIEAGSWLAGQRLREFERLEGAAHTRVCVIFRGAKVMVPDDGQVLAYGDHIYVATTRDELDASLAFMGVERLEKVRQVFIVGGGEVGLELARALGKEGVAVKLFERDARRSEYLAGELPRAVVVNADGTDQETMLRENIEGANAFVSLTPDDDDNLIACLLARRLGVDKVVPLLDRLNYLPLAQRLGINTTVSRRVKAADALLEYIRKGGVLSVRTLGEEEVEAMELEVLPESGYANKPLADIKCPPGTRIAAIVRPDGTVTLPDAASVMHPGDRAVFFVLESSVRQLESAVLAGGRSRRWLG